MVIKSVPTYLTLGRLIISTPKQNDGNNKQKDRKEKAKKTYNTRDSLVVTHPTTSLAVAGLSRGERTGSRVFQCLWSYVIEGVLGVVYYLLGEEAGWEGCEVYLK